MTDPIVLLTKLHPPAVPPQTVVRERLLERLDEPRRLTVVAAPAGFGKSTLLASWAQRRQAAWLTLDERDDDATVLWSHIVAALGLDLAVAAMPLREVLLPRLVNALTEAPATLILDDFHRLSQTEDVAWFIEHVPASTRIVLASRTAPRLPLASWRANGQLLELTDLAFTVEEAQAFLHNLGVEADAEFLTARTEGWAAGLYLAALTLADRPERAQAFGGTNAHVVDYLSSEVLATFDEAQLDFMLRTSVLERLCAPLCDAVLQSSGSDRFLRTLASTNLFLRALDDERRWYRFHHLFAELLRDEFAGDARELHLRASRWHRENGTIDEAIHHALAAGEARELIAEQWVHYTNSGRTASVLDWLGSVELPAVEAWILALRGDEPGMRAALARIEPAQDDGPLPDGFASLESSVSTLRAAFAWGDVDAVIEHGRHALRLEPEGSPWRPVITWALGWGHYCRGELDESERWFTETAGIAPAADQWVVGIGAIADLSLIAAQRGDRATQDRRAREAYALAQEHGLFEAREDGEVHTAYGVSLAAAGRHAEAEAALRQGVFLRRLWAQPLDLVDGLLALAPYDASALDEAAALLERCSGATGLQRRLAALRPALSERERSILALLAGEKSEREIADELFLSFNTVHTHVRSIYRKLGVSSRAEAVARQRTTER